jgi:flagellar hook-length control protein FliK
VTFVPYERPAVHQPLPEPADSLQGSLRLQVHVTPSQLVEHIVANARLASDGSSQAQLQLQPESLGRLHINMTVHDGRINLVMTAETPQAQQAIMDGLADLATALSAAGMTLAQANVTLSNNGHNRHFAQPGSNAWHGDSEEDVGPVETAMWPRSLSILDLSA